MAVLLVVTGRSSNLYFKVRQLLGLIRYSLTLTDKYVFSITTDRCITVCSHTDVGLSEG